MTIFKLIKDVKNESSAAQKRLLRISIIILGLILEDYT
jgi:hypothetical protein